ncbi:MAG: 50S ribosomal protein L6 [Patescibacteria group bacterium]
MSRIGKKHIEIPNGVKVDIKDGTVTINGLKGTLSYEYRPEIEVKVEDNSVVCLEKIKTKDSYAYWGLTRALINNMIIGVTEGFTRELELIGVGYRAKPINGGIELSVGYSHPVEYIAPEGIKIEVEDQKKLKVTGIDKQLVGLTASKIREIRKPEPYKGKGIKYIEEVILRKPGKAGKV